MVKVTIESVPSITNLKIITIKGTIDSVTYKQVDEEVYSVMEQENTNVVLDLSYVHYVSSMGMICLINYLKYMTDKEKVLKFVRPPQHVQNSLEAAGIAGKFDMYDSLEAAIQSLR